MPRRPSRSICWRTRTSLKPTYKRKTASCFRWATGVLTPADQQSLADAFDAVEREEMGEGTHERYHQWIHELVKK